jgi:hypothetical protein
MTSSEREKYLQNKIQSLIEVLKIMKNRLDKFVDIYGNLDGWEQIDIQEYIDIDLNEETEEMNKNNIIILDEKINKKKREDISNDEKSNGNTLKEKDDTEILAMIKVLYIQILDMINHIKYQNDILNVQYKNLNNIKDILKKYSE